MKTLLLSLAVLLGGGVAPLAAQSGLQILGFEDLHENRPESHQEAGGYTLAELRKELVAIQGVTPLETQQRRGKVASKKLPEVVDLTAAGLESLRGSFSHFYNEASQTMLQVLDGESIQDAQAFLRETERIEQEVVTQGFRIMVETYQEHGITVDELLEVQALARKTVGYLDPMHELMVELLYHLRDFDETDIERLGEGYPIFLHNQSKENQAQAAENRLAFEQEARQLLRLDRSAPMRRKELENVFRMLSPSSPRILGEIGRRYIPRMPDLPQVGEDTLLFLEAFEPTVFSMPSTKRAYQAVHQEMVELIRNIWWKKYH